MQYPLTFLSAADGTKLTKDADKDIPYPHVYRFTSLTYTITTLKEFQSLLEEHALQYNCLLKGEILTNLKNQPRAGSTSSYTETNWICLDIDGLDIKHEKELIDLIPELRNRAYIKQESASSGFKSGMRCHLFFLLDKPADPALLKLWLTNINVTHLLPHITLNKAGTALKYPLDITVCQNDKLIYIAPPICKKDPIKIRIKLVKPRSPGTVSLNFATLNPETVKTAVHKHKNKLRHDVGLPRRKDRFQAEILLNPSEANITDIKYDRGFVYLNLNGGNSYGYYYPQDNPEVLYNFKSEPSVYLKDIAPEYYKKITAVPEVKDDNANPDDSKPNHTPKRKYWLAFNDKKTDTYHVGYYDTTDGSSDIHATRNKAKVADYLKEHGQPVPDFIPTWRYETDFSTDVEFDFTNKFINRFKRSDYLRNSVPSAAVPPLISKLLNHTFGDSVDHFLNWAAVICQKRIRTTTAWVLGGIQGSGKGSITELLLMPLIGPEHVKVLNIANLESDFNSFADNTLLVAVDEAQVSNSKQVGKIMNKVKHLITERHITVNRKFIPEYTIQNHMNFLFMGNQYDITQIDPDDRRYNVPARQETKLIGNVLTKTQIEKGIKAELHAFAGYLLAYDIDIQRAATVIHTEEKERIQELTRDSNQQIVDNLKAGNLQFFYDNRPDHEDPIQFEMATRITTTISYDEVLASFLEGVDIPINIPNDYLRLIFYYLGDQHFKSSHKFTKFLNHKGLYPKSINVGTRTTRGLHSMDFKASDKLAADIKKLGINMKLVKSA